MGRDELEARLIELDKAAGLLYPNQHFKMLLVGGSALILLGALERATADIDALVAPALLQGLLESYDINSRVVAYQDSFSDDIEDRLVGLDLPTTTIEYYAASLEDLVASKLCSGREVDELDIRKPEVLKVLDWDKLDGIIKDMEHSVLSSRTYKTLLFNYGEYVKEYQKCAN
jgi:hypothetical protein